LPAALQAIRENSAKLTLISLRTRMIVSLAKEEKKWGYIPLMDVPQIGESITSPSKCGQYLSLFLVCF